MGTDHAGFDCSVSTTLAGPAYLILAVHFDIFVAHQFLDLADEDAHRY
jgi:hypothetical protein